MVLGVCRVRRAAARGGDEEGAVDGRGDVDELANGE
jgi:hypothetical protein